MTARRPHRLSVLAIAGSFAAIMLGSPAVMAQVATPTSSPVASPVAANQAMLPIFGPDGLDVVEDSWDTLDTVSAMLEAVTTREEIAAQDYIGGATRIWSASNPATIPQGDLVYLEISIHAFEDADGAATALPYIADAFQLGGLQPVDGAPAFGDLSQVFTVTDPGKNVTITQVLVQQGGTLYQVQGRAINGDPLPAIEGWLETLELEPGP